MTSFLQTSDYVAIACAIVQIVTTIGVAVWTVRKTAPESIADASTGTPSTRALVLQWLRSSWLYAVGVGLGIAATTKVIGSDDPLTKEYVVRLVIAAVYAAINLTALFASFFGFLQQRMNEIVHEALRGVIDVQRNQLHVSRDTLAALMTRTGVLRDALAASKADCEAIEAQANRQA